MSCGCTSTPSPSITCGSCGYQCTSCVCPPDPIVMPTVTCADPATCTEVYPLECVQYTGEDIKCSTSASTLYPNVTHIVATNGDMLPDILNNINNQLCYLFSADFISTLLNNINDNGDLETLFCTMVGGCGGSATQLICPTVSNVTYVTNSTQNYLQAQFNYVPYATSYTYQFYTETTYGSGTYNVLVGSATTIPQPSIALPISVTTLLSSTNTANKNYAILVYVQDSSNALTANGINPASNSSFTYSSLDVNNAHCGINRYLGSAESQTCSLSAIHTPMFKNVPNNTLIALQFIFAQEPSLSSAYVPITSYKVHWYLQKTLPNVQYDYQGDEIFNYSSGLTTDVNLFKLPVSATFTKSGTIVTVTSNNHGLISNQQIKIDTAVSTDIPTGTYSIAVTGTNTFMFQTPGSSTVGSSTPVTYKSQLNPNTDKVVVMVLTNTGENNCYNGISPRINGTFTESEINTYISNPQNNVFKNF